MAIQNVTLNMLLVFCVIQFQGLAQGLAKRWASFLFAGISRHATTVALVDKHAALSEANQY